MALWFRCGHFWHDYEMGDTGGVTSSVAKQSILGDYADFSGANVSQEALEFTGYETQQVAVGPVLRIWSRGKRATSPH